MDKRIEAFINNELSDEEIRELEEHLRTDKQLAEELAFYLSVKRLAAQSPQRSRLEKRHEEWRQLKKGNVVTPILGWRWAVAALVVVGICLAWLLNTSPSSDLRGLSGKYISANFETLSVRMSGPESNDSLQTAINAFNGGDLQHTLAICEGILQRDPSNTEAMKTAGIAALRSKDYDKAIQYFQTLGNDTSLYGNPGRFYEALALLQKGGEQDIKQAEELLDEVIARDLEGKRESEKWRKGD